MLTTLLTSPFKTSTRCLTVAFVLMALGALACLGDMRLLLSIVSLSALITAPLSYVVVVQTAVAHAAWLALAFATASFVMICAASIKACAHFETL